MRGMVGVSHEIVNAIRGYRSRLYVLRRPDDSEGLADAEHFGDERRLGVKCLGFGE